MSDANKPLRDELEATLADVIAAEQALGAVLRELNAGVRADKVTVTQAVEAAFRRLRSSREALARIRVRLGGEPPSGGEDGEHR